MIQLTNAVGKEGGLYAEAAHPSAFFKRPPALPD